MKVTIKTNGKKLPKWTYKARKKAIKKYKIKKGQKLT